MVGTTISHYKITEKLGEGGMGVVYKAEDTKLKRPVALKFLAPHLLRDEEGHKRFLREAQAAAALDHPNICTVYEIDEADGRTFIVMALLEGHPLSKRIAEGPLNLIEALSIAIQMAEGLEAAHAKGITHRDVKPDNVMLVSGSRGLVKLMDFGLAQLAGSSKFTSEGATLGTVNYMSPEQMGGLPTDSRTDIWSLGIVFYEMLCGQVPFRGEYDQAVIYAIANERPLPVTSQRSGIPIEVDWVVEKALAKDPHQRHQSVRDLNVDLASIQRKLTSHHYTPWNPSLSEGTVVAAADLGTSQGLQSDRIVGQSKEHTHALHKRRIRDLLLDLGSQGLLPDSILAAALDLIVHDQLAASEVSQRRRLLLDDLLFQRVRVGEFVEEWHRHDKAEKTQEAKRVVEGDRKQKKGRDYRAKTEVFGLPLIHIATGVAPDTGEPRVAKGLLAIGRIAIGGVALGSRFAAGLMAVGPLSMGMLSLGIVAIGGETVGLIQLAMPWDAFWGALFLTFAVFPAWRYVRGRKVLPDTSAGAEGVADGWAVFKKRIWRNDSRCFYGGAVVSICGVYEVDLSATEVTDGRAILDASVVCGAVRVRVPPRWGVTVDGNAILGDYTNKIATPSRQADYIGSELLLTGVSLFGVVTVQQ